MHVVSKKPHQLHLQRQWLSIIILPTPKLHIDEYARNFLTAQRVRVKDGGAYAILKMLFTS